MEEGRYNYARDGFVYLLSYATLLISSIGLNFLLKAIVDKFIQDPLESMTGPFGDEAIIGFMAAVLIAFPIFTYLNFVANRMLKSGRMKADSGVRNWLLYITMVVVILIIIWQVIQLFVAFLNGILAARFIIHTLITLAIAATVLGYQWWHLRTFAHEPKIGSGFRIFEWIVFVVAAAAIVGSFFVIDSPAERRAKRLDNIRVERLSTIQNAVQEYYGFKNGTGNFRLPKDLDELIAYSRVYIPENGLLDPVTKERFEYRTTGATTYQLCAIFDRESEDKTAMVKTSPVTMVEEPDSIAQRFKHGVGRTCFDLKVSQ